MTETSKPKQKIPRADAWGYFFIIASFTLLPAILLLMKRLDAEPLYRDGLMALWGLGLMVDGFLRDGRSSQCRGLLIATAIGAICVPVWHTIRFAL